MFKIDEIKLKKQILKRNITIFKFIHQLLYFVVYYLTFSILYAYNFFNAKNAFYVKAFLRIWSTFSALLFVIFCLMKFRDVMNDNSKKNKFLLITLTLLAIIYFVTEFLRIVEMFHYIGLSTINENIKLSPCTILYTVIFSFSMMISTAYAIDSLKSLYDAKNNNKEIISETISFVRSLLDAFSLALFVLGYIIGDLEKKGVINRNSDTKIIKLSIFVFCAFLSTISITFALYDVLREKDTKTDFIFNAQVCCNNGECNSY